jgi:transposase-like protein
MQELEPDWLSKVTTYQKCPHCKKGDLATRVPRSFSHKYLMFWANFKRYRCDDCNKQAHVRQHTLN